MNRVVIGLLVAVSCVSLYFNFSQRQQVKIQEMKEFLYKEKEKLISNGYEDMIYQAVIKGNNDSSYRQGKIEGMISVATEKMKIDPNDVSEIWHRGYYQGLSQIVFQEKTAYEKGYNQAAVDHNREINREILEKHLATHFKDANEPVTEKK